MDRALQAAENLVALKGHGFSRAVNAVKSTRASSTEGCFHCSYLKIGLFRSLFSPCLHSFSSTCALAAANLKNCPCMELSQGLQTAL
jgi:hypothetical protein